MTEFPARIKVHLRPEGGASPDGLGVEREYILVDLYNEMERENARLRDGLEAAHQYGSDTMVGPKDLKNITLTEWYRSGAKEMTQRLRRVLSGHHWHNDGGV